MALIVETGEGLPDADSYVSLDDAIAYHAAQGNTAWAAATVTDEQREVALRRATAYVDSRYRFRGSPLTVVQALEWPREGPGLIWPNRRVIHATCELALRALAGPLYADVAAEGRIKSETVGPIKTDYAEPVNGGQTRYAVTDDLLAPLLASAAPARQTRMLRG